MLTRVLKIGLGVPVALFVGFFLSGLVLPKWLFYHNRRPTRFGRIVNEASGWLYRIPFLPGFLVSLETTGRRSGRPYTIPVVIADYAGEQYLVSMLGERSGWVPNIRAAGGKAVLKHGRRRDVMLDEVPVAERAPIIKAYVRRAIGGRPHIAAAPDDPIERFEAIAAEHPVFRIRYDATPQEQPTPASALA